MDDPTLQIPQPGAADQLRQELHRVIRRYAAESDVTYAAALGVLAIVQHELLTMADSLNSQDG